MFAFLKNWRLSHTKLLMLYTLYITVVFNYAFYREVLRLQPFSWGNPDSYFLLTVPVVLFCALFIALQAFSLPFIHKIAIPILLLVGASISYYSVHMNIYFDMNMLDTVLQTNTTESLSLITPSYLLWLFAFGILPALAYLNTQIAYHSFFKEMAIRILAMLVSGCVIWATAQVFMQDYMQFHFNNNKKINYLITPANFIGASIKKIKTLRHADMPYTQLDPNAKLQKSHATRNITVIVVGESARAHNWGLNGYARQTTPLLAKRGDEIFNFRHVSGCGTATAVSVPCMFSAFERDNYDAAKAARQDNILDIVQRAGVDLLWLANNDCKDVCSRIPTKHTKRADAPKLCPNSECLDNIMLLELDRALAEESDKDLLVVLHTIGSHGPNYHEHYSSEFQHFQPACHSNEFNHCSKQQLSNSYDNSILYTDQLLDQIIRRLEQKTEWSSSLYYVSDHGESLGENGIYMHGTPYAIAPEFQTKVPMVLWFSPTFLKQKAVDFACLREQAHTQNHSHDNLFHTLFSLTDLDKSLSSYRADLDILARCAKQP